VYPEAADHAGREPWEFVEERALRDALVSQR
jgi:hypothetical protein